LHTGIKARLPFAKGDYGKVITAAPGIAITRSRPQDRRISCSRWGARLSREAAARSACMRKKPHSSSAKSAKGVAGPHAL